MYFKVHCDYETAEKVGASGTFQIIDIIDSNEIDCSDLIDQGKHYHSLEDVKNDLAIILKIKAEKIELEQV